MTATATYLLIFAEILSQVAVVGVAVVLNTDCSRWQLS